MFTCACAHVQRFSSCLRFKCWKENGIHDIGRRGKVGHQDSAIGSILCWGLQTVACCKGLYRIPDLFHVLETGCSGFQTVSCVRNRV